MSTRSTISAVPFAQPAASAQTINHRIEVTYLPLSVIKTDPRNPRVHKPRQLKALVKSIRSLGYNMPIAIDSQGVIVAGHARFAAAQILGMSEVPVIVLDHLSAAQAQAFLLADNRLSEMSTWDEQLLAVQLKELSVLNLDFDIEATGFSVGEIDLHIESLDVESPKGKTDPADNFTTLRGPAITQVGDLWQLGAHRLLCGNALDPAAYPTLMEALKAAMVITDPPYNVKIDGHVGGKGAIKHREFAMAVGEMSEEEFTAFLRTIFLRLIEFSIDGSLHIIFMDWRHLPEILTAGRSTYTAYLNLCVWKKSQAGMGSLYRSQHELALLFKSGKAPHRNNVELGRFGRYRTNIWNYPSIHAMRYGEEGDLLTLHPTVKPIKMIADAILDSSKRGDLILDPFLGSGTTLLACERVGRICRAIELDPLYVDTSIRRWQALTGEDAILVSTGETFTQREHVAHSAQEVKHG